MLNNYAVCLTNSSQIITQDFCPLPELAKPAMPFLNLSGIFVELNSNLTSSYTLKEIEGRALLIKKNNDPIEKLIFNYDNELAKTYLNAKNMRQKLKCLRTILATIEKEKKTSIEEIKELLFQKHYASYQIDILKKVDVFSETGKANLEEEGIDSQVAVLKNTINFSEKITENLIKKIPKLIKESEILKEKIENVESDHLIYNEDLLIKKHLKL